MNKIYHIVQGYKNWQKYFHTASLDWNLQKRTPDEYFDYTLINKLNEIFFPEEMEKKYGISVGVGVE